ncbi:MAG: hypothetical protein M3R70_06435 [Actinomycetota bacterium]|nr:hypothetical protein [Actinomycetota bacterium]
MLAAAGCGRQRAAEAPQLPRPLAASLAAQADAVAEALDANDPCGARQRAIALRSMVTAAINKGRVRGALQEPLLSSANSLASRIACIVVTPPPTTTQDEDHNGQDNGGKKDKKRKHDGGGGDGGGGE